MGDISLGESRAKVQAEYGTEGHGYHVTQRYGSAAGIAVEGYYHLHGYVVVIFDGDQVERVRFASPYYRTNDGFGVGSRIPLGPCHQTATNSCEHRWHGFIWNAFKREGACNCWVKVGDGTKSLAASADNFLKPWYFVFTNRGRVVGFDFDLRFVD